MYQNNNQGNFNNTNFLQNNQGFAQNNTMPDNEWNFNISSDEMDSDFVLLPPGTYQYTIINFEKARHTPRQGGTGKIDRPCPKIILHLRIMSSDGQEVKLKSNLFIHPACAFSIGGFFRSIGHIKKGEDLNPATIDWNRVIGSTGMCKIKHRQYNENTYNEVDRFLEPQENSPQHNMQGDRFSNDLPSQPNQNINNFQGQGQTQAPIQNQQQNNSNEDLPF